jgi:hypothetical protein
MRQIVWKAAFSAALAASVVAMAAAQMSVNLSKEMVGRPPVAFEPIVGTWVIAQDGADKVVMVDGRPWVASKDNPTRLLIESARKLYGTSNEELMDNAKQFAYYPIALLKGIDNFSNGTLRVQFKTVSGASDRCSGIVFNVKSTGDWLAIRYNDTEQNVALWEFHNGIRRMVKRGEEGAWPLDKAAWHELAITINGAALAATMDGKPALEYTLGSEPVAGRRGPPHPDLYPANNPVLRPPVSGRVGLWSKTDSTSYFKGFVVSNSK